MGNSNSNLLFNGNCYRAAQTTNNSELLLLEPVQAKSHSLRKERCKAENHKFVWWAEPFKCTYCHLTKKYGFNCRQCDTFQCFDCDNTDFEFNTHYCPNNHILKNSKELKECNRCLLKNDGYECVGCKYFICTSKICRKFNSNSEKRLPSIEGLLTSFHGHLSSVNCIILFTNTQLISCSDDKSIKIWDIEETGCLNTLLGHEAEVENLIQIDNEKILSTSKDDTMKFWNILESTCIKTLPFSSNGLTCLLKFDESQLIGSQENLVKFWNLEKLNVTKELKPHGKYEINTVLAINKNRIVSGSEDHSIKITDIETSVCVGNLIAHTGDILTLVKLNDYKIISGGKDNSLRIWDITTNTLLYTFTSHTNSVKSIVLHNDSHIISGSFDHTIKIWNMKGTCLQTIKGHIRCVNTLVSLGGYKFISASKDHSIKEWFAEI